MTTMSKTALGIAAGVCGTLVLGYCWYFDKKRRADPNFKRKLRERRKVKKEAGKLSNSTKFPNLTDHESVQKFFLQEIQLGEMLLASGELEEGIEHLGNAISVCGQPHDLLRVLRQTLPPQVFQLLLQKLPSLGLKLMNQETGSGMEEEDVE